MISTRTSWNNIIDNNRTETYCTEEFRKAYSSANVDSGPLVGHKPVIE